MHKGRQKIFQLQTSEGVFFKTLYIDDLVFAELTMLFGFNSVDLNQASHLSVLLEEEEIKEALIGMNPSKVQGPNGFPVSFYQKNWEVVKPNLITFIHSTFHNSNSIKSVNGTLTSLIFKFPNPDYITQYVNYKILPKILINRIKPFLNSLVAKE